MDSYRRVLGASGWVPVIPWKDFEPSFGAVGLKLKAEWLVLRAEGFEGSVGFVLGLVVQWDRAALHQSTETRVPALLCVLPPANTSYPAEGGHRHLAGDPAARQQHQCLPGDRRGRAHHAGATGHGQTHRG